AVRARRAADHRAGLIDADVVLANLPIFAGRALAALADAEHASVAVVALNAATRVDAAAVATDLAVRADDVGAGVRTSAARAHLTRRAVDVGARLVDAQAVGRANLTRQAAELTGAATRHALAAVADLVGAAQVALVDRAVAVVVERVARLCR